jgi:hypothetical protein
MATVRYNALGNMGQGSVGGFKVTGATKPASAKKPSLASTFSPKGVGLYGPTPTGGNVQAAKAASPIMAALNKIGFSYW